MRYFQAYRFLFESPKWMTNLMIGAVCLIVPIVGQMVFQGYFFDIMEDKLRSRKGKGYPDFNFDRLMPYLVRGAWPFLIQYVLQLPLQMVSGGFALYIQFSVLSSMRPATPGGPPRIGDFPWALVLIFVGVVIVLGLVIGLITVPLSLRAGLGQDFAKAFNLSFFREFLGKMWVELILVELFLMVTAPFVIAAGLLLCCIGVLPAAALVTFAQYHLWYQLYELYLEKGGTPIPLKEPEPPTEPAEGPRHYPADEEN